MNRFFIVSYITQSNGIITYGAIDFKTTDSRFFAKQELDLVLKEEYNLKGEEIIVTNIFEFKNEKDYLNYTRKINNT